MSVLTDIQQMQKEGRTEEEIMVLLKQRGVSPRETSDALIQSKIKEAVVDAPQAPAEASYSNSPGDYTASPALNQNSSQIQTPAEAQEQYSPYQSQPAAESQADAYQPQYQEQGNAEQGNAEQQVYTPQLSSDTISEISEQVVTEKLSPLRKQIEKIIDLKTTLESKMEYLDERLKRIENIIDRLQLSVLQKVGDYVNNVDDIKKELIETQKSFKALLPETKQKKEKSSEKAEKSD